jgi:hypothetical protein
MTDTILKQNAGRGGAEIVKGPIQIPAGNYCAIEFLTSGGFLVAMNAPLLEGNQLSLSLPAGFRIDTPIIGGSGIVNATAILYRSV